MKLHRADFFRIPLSLSAKFNCHHSGLHSLISSSSLFFLPIFFSCTYVICLSIQIYHLSTIHPAHCYWIPAMLGVGTVMVNKTDMMSARAHEAYIPYNPCRVLWKGFYKWFWTVNNIVDVPTSLPPSSSSSSISSNGVTPLLIFIPTKSQQKLEYKPNISDCLGLVEGRTTQLLPCSPRPISTTSDSRPQRLLTVVSALGLPWFPVLMVGCALHVG